MDTPTEELQLATIEESGFWKHMDDIDHHYMTCVNHPTARYITKNPFSRSLHFIKAPEGFGYFDECPCPFSDLRVILNHKGD